VWRDPNPRRQQTAEVIQDQLAEVGIDIQLSPSPDFAFLDEGNFDIALFGWVGGTSLGANVSIYTTGEGQNFGRYSNTEVDDLFAETSVELDPDARADLFNEVDSLLWEDLPTIPLFQNPDVLTWHSGSGTARPTTGSPDPPGTPRLDRQLVQRPRRAAGLP
jgi:peptide/nickel transport system substrate-binding protein